MRAMKKKISPCFFSAVYFFLSILAPGCGWVRYSEDNLIPMTIQKFKKELDIDIRVSLKEGVFCLAYDDPEMILGLGNGKKDQDKQNQQEETRAAVCEAWNLDWYMKRLAASLINENIRADMFFSSLTGVRSVRVLAGAERDPVLALKCEPSQKITIKSDEESEILLIFKNLVARKVKKVESMYALELARVYSRKNGKTRSDREEYDFSIEENVSHRESEETVWLDKAAVQDDQGKILFVIEREEWQKLLKEEDVYSKSSGEKGPPWMERLRRALYLASRIALSTSADIDFIDLKVSNPAMNMYLKFVRYMTDIKGMQLMRFPPTELQSRRILEIEKGG